MSPALGDDQPANFENAVAAEFMAAFSSVPEGKRWGHLGQGIAKRGHVCCFL